MASAMLSTCPVCGRKAMVDVEGPTIDYGCHSVPPVGERTLEQVIDERVQRRLATDSEYRYAESAEAQAEREAVITREVEQAMGVAWDLGQAEDEPPD